MEQFSYGPNSARKNLLAPADLRSLKVVLGGRYWRLPIIRKAAALPSVGSSGFNEWKQHYLNAGYEASVIDDFYGRYQGRAPASLSIGSLVGGQYLVTIGESITGRNLTDEDKLSDVLRWWSDYFANPVYPIVTENLGLTLNNELGKRLIASGFDSAGDAKLDGSANSIGGFETIGISNASPKLSEAQRTIISQALSGMSDALNAPFRLKGIIVVSHTSASSNATVFDSVGVNELGDPECALITAFTNDNSCKYFVYVLDKKYWNGAASLHRNLMKVWDPAAVGVWKPAVASVSDLGLGYTLSKEVNAPLLSYAMRSPVQPIVDLSDWQVPATGIMDKLLAIGEISQTTRSVGGQDYVEYIIACNKLRFSVDSKYLTGALDSLAEGSGAESAVKEKKQLVDADVKSGIFMVTVDNANPLPVNTFDYSKSQLFRDMIEADGISAFKNREFVPGETNDEKLTYGQAEGIIAKNGNVYIAMIPEAAIVKRSYTVGNEIVSIPEYTDDMSIVLNDDGYRTGELVSSGGVKIRDLEEANIRWLLLNSKPVPDFEAAWHAHFFEKTVDEVNEALKPSASPEDYRTTDPGSFTDGVFVRWENLSDDAKNRLVLVTKGTIRKQKFLEAAVLDTTRLSFA